MSDNKHTDQAKVMFWIDENQLEYLDKIIKEYGYTSRAEWFRAVVRMEIKDYEEAQARQK